MTKELTELRKEFDKKFAILRYYPEGKAYHQEFEVDRLSLNEIWNFFAPHLSHIKPNGVSPTKEPPYREDVYVISEEKMESIKKESYEQGARDFDEWLDKTYKIGVDAETFLTQQSLDGGDGE